MPVLLGVTLTRFVAMWHYARHRKVYPGFRVFVLSEFFGLVGMIMVCLRSWIGESLSVVLLSTVGSLAQQLTVYHGLGVYTRAPKLNARTLQNVLLTAVVGLALLADLLFAPDMARRVLLFSLASLFLCLRIGVELPLVNCRRQAGVTLLYSTFLVAAAFHAARAWDMLGQQGYDYSGMMLVDSFLAILIFFRILQSVLELYVVFSVNSQMLEDDLHAATAQIEHMAQSDALTGALNRRGLEILGGEALQKSWRQGQPASVIMLDLDHFKNVNDTLGHVAGDVLLHAVATLCQDSLRGEDVFARYGGEEFVVVAPFSGQREAQQLAERMRQAVETASFPIMQGKSVTASFGVASARQDSLQMLLKRADEALYAAKRAGRNCVVLATPADTVTGLA